jgi:hypothetical protein
MMTKYDDGSGTHKAAWEEMMSMMTMHGHGANHSSATLNDD